MLWGCGPLWGVQLHTTETKRNPNPNTSPNPNNPTYPTDPTKVYHLTVYVDTPAGPWARILPFTISVSA